MREALLRVGFVEGARRDSETNGDLPQRRDVVHERVTHTVRELTEADIGIGRNIAIGLRPDVIALSEGGGERRRGKRQNRNDRCYGGETAHQRTARNHGDATNVYGLAKILLASSASLYSRITCGYLPTHGICVTTGI